STAPRRSPEDRGALADRLRRSSSQRIVRRPHREPVGGSELRKDVNEIVVPELLEVFVDLRLELLLPEMVADPVPGFLERRHLLRLPAFQLQDVKREG